MLLAGVRLNAMSLSRLKRLEVGTVLGGLLPSVEEFPGEVPDLLTLQGSHSD